MASDPSRQNSTSTRPRVLLVDDDAAIGRVVSRMLREIYDVTVMTSGREALAELTSASATYDVIVCDLMMPEVSGMDVYAKLAEVDARAAARVIFFSGGAFTRRGEEFLRSVCNPRLEKPFNRAVLLSAIETVLERKGA